MNPIRSPLSALRLSPSAAALLVSSALATEPQAAQVPATPPATDAASASASAPARSAKPADTRCVDVEVNGERVPDYACLGQLMTSPAPPVSPDANLSGSERIVRQPPTKLGLANRAATQQRMGNTFGTSTRPQRPPPPPPKPVIPGR